jgi:hypothetical protein
MYKSRQPNQVAAFTVRGIALAPKRGLGFLTVRGRACGIDVIAENGVKHSIKSHSTISALDRRVEVVHHHPWGAVELTGLPGDGGHDSVRVSQ